MFITKSYFSVPKDVRLCSTHYLIMNRKELQNIAINHSIDIDYNDFVRIYRECTREPYSFLPIDTTSYKKDTGNTFPKKLILISKNKVKGKSKWAICLTKRNLIHEIEGKYDLESKLEIYLQLFTD